MPNNKSLDDIFSDTPEPEEAPALKVNATKGLNDIFGEDEEEPKAAAPMRVNTSPASLNLIPGSPTGPMIPTGPKGRPVNDGDLAPVRAGLASMISGFGLNYPEEYFSDKTKREMQEHPGYSTVGRLVGMAAPSHFIAKGVGAVGKGLAAGGKYIPGFVENIGGMLAGQGATAGAVTGAAEGAVLNPGKDGSRTANATQGGLMGGILGGASAYVSKQGRRADLANRIGEEGFKGEVRGKVQDALERARKNEVVPRIKEVDEIADKSGKTMLLDIDDIRGMERDASTGLPRKKGGLERFADKLDARRRAEKPSYSGYGKIPDGDKRVEVPIKTGLRARRLFDAQANWIKDRTDSAAEFAPKVKDYGDKANKYRGPVAAADPRIDPLHEKIKEALDLMGTVQRKAKTNPLALIEGDPTRGVGQDVLTLDKMAKTNLSGLGRDIVEARKMRAPIEDVFSWQSPGMILGKVLRGTGAVANKTKFDKWPVGTKESIINALINQPKNYTEE